MTELMGWMILIALAVNIIGICMLSYQIERQSRVTLEFLLRSNEMILAALGQTATQPAAAGGSTAPERRHAQRRNPLTRLIDATRRERRMVPHRRLEDLLQN